jgi:hypothetical protein
LEGDLIMGMIERIERAYACLMEFENKCDNAECKQLIDILLPMLFRNNNGYLKISVGTKISESKFHSLLSMTTNNFIVKLSKYGNEPQLIFEDEIPFANTITVINLMLVKDIHIEIESDENDSVCYNIQFTYNNINSYNITITSRK